MLAEITMADQADEIDLLRRVQAGEGFDLLQAELEPPIRRFVRHLMVNEADETIDDIVQDIFISLYRNLDRIEPIENLRPYTFGIARKRCYTEMRRRKRVQYNSLDDDFLEFDAPDDAETPEEVTHLLMLHLEVQEAIEQLPDVQRRALVMFCEEEMSYQEIAEMMGTTIGTVKSRIYYAKRGLRGLLKPDVLSAIENEFE